MDRKSRAYAYLAFWGETFSPQEFSDFIGIQATLSGIKGEVVRPGILRKESFWQYEQAATDDCLGLDNSLEQLRIIFSERVGLIRQFMRLHQLEARCTVVLTIQNKENPGLRLSPRFIHLLTEIGAGFELDGYQ